MIGVRFLHSRADFADGGIVPLVESWSTLWTFIGRRWLPRGFTCTIRWPHPPILVVFGSFSWGVPKLCLEQSCSPRISTKFFCHDNAKVGGKGTGARWGWWITQNWLHEPIKGTWKNIWASSCTDLWHLYQLHLTHKLSFRWGILLIWFFVFWFVMPPHNYQPNYDRDAYKWCAVIRKPRSAWPNQTALP